MELKLKASEKIKVIYEDKEYFLSKPKMSQSLALEESLAKPGANTNKLGLEFLVSCGLPMEVLLDLEPEAVQQVTEALMPSKKKG